MARKVVFHGRVIIHPGAEVYVDLTGMVQPGVDVSRIASVVGEAPLGEPGVVHVFADAEAARQYFGEGSDLADGVNLLTDPSSDVRVNNGAALVYAYKANRTTLAERWLVQDVFTRATNTPFILGVSAAGDYDAALPIPNAFVEIRSPGWPSIPTDENAFQNMIIEVSSGWGKGQQRQIESSTFTAGTPDLLRFYLRGDQDWTTTPVHPTIPTTVRVTVPQLELLAGVWGAPGNDNEVDHGPSTTDQAYELASKYRLRIEAQAAPYGGQLEPVFYLKFDPTTGGPSSNWLITANWVVPPSVIGVAPVVGTTVAAGATETLLNGSSQLLAANTYRQQWALITGVISPAQAPILGKMYKIKDNGIGDITLYGAGLDLGLPPGLAYDGISWTVLDFTSAFFTVDGENGVPQSFNIYINNETSATQKLVAGFDLTTITTLEDLRARINELDGFTARIGDGFALDDPTGRFDFGPRSEHYGEKVTQFLGTPTLVGASQLPIDAVGGREGITAFPQVGFPYKVLVGRGLPKEEYFWVGSISGANLDVSGATETHAADETVEYVNNFTQLAQLGSDIVRGPADFADYGQVVFDNNQKLVDWAGNNIGRFTAQRSTAQLSQFFREEAGAAQPEDDSGIYKKFQNSRNLDSVMEKQDPSDPFYPISWENGLEELVKYEDARVEVPLVSSRQPGWSSTDMDAFIRMYDEHLKVAEENRNYIQGYLGLILPLEAGTYGGTVFSKGLLEWIRELDEERLAICGQNLRVFDSQNRDVVLPPWAFACESAGIQLGTDLGEGLTFKFLRTNALSQPFNDWDPRSRSDSNKGLLGGLLFGEPTRGRWRIVRGLTTHVSSDNLARTDINVWEIRNFIIQDISVQLEDRFIGRGIGTPGDGVRFVAPASVANIREHMATVLEEYRSEGIIVDSIDEQGQRIHAWRALVVHLSGDIATIKVQVFPKVALNFILVDFAFQLPVVAG